jgi:hypothetical protein
MIGSVWSSCYQNQEGCLNVRAANFDVTADIPCEDDCCEFPELRLSIQHNFTLPDTNATVRFNIDNNSLYSANGVDSFGLREVRFYISDVMLVRSNGEMVEVEDNINFFYLNGLDTVAVERDDNYALINRQNISTREIGVINTEGRFSELHFRIGLPEATRNLLPTKLPDSHPLALGDSTLYNFDTGEYEVVSLTLIRPALSDTLSIDILESEWQAEVTLPSDFTILTGFDATIAIGIDYRIWWDGLAINQATEEQIKEHLKRTIPASFELLEVR